MVLSYSDFGNNAIFDEDLYALKNEYRVTKENKFGSLQGDSVFDDEGGNHKVSIAKDDIANCKVEFSTDGVFSINSDKLISNTALGVEVQTDKRSVSISGDYTADQWRAKATIDASAKGELSLSNEAVISSDGISVGISFQVDKAASISDVNAAVSWDVNESATYTAQTENNCKNMLFTCVKKVGTDAELAGRLSYDFDHELPELSFGAKCPLLGGNSQWLLGSRAAKLLYSKKLSENVEGEFAVNFPVARGFAGMTHGFRLAFS